MGKRRISIAVAAVFFVSIYFSELLLVDHAAAALPVPGKMVGISKNYSPSLLRGIRFDQNDPFKLEFVFDKGDDILFTRNEKEELIRYFLAALAIPEKKLWVNLSPYEPDRVINDNVVNTDIGKTLLSQDYLLKQLASSLTHPDTLTGRAYWSELTADSLKLNAIQSDALNKIWIKPDKISLYDDGSLIFVSDAALKVESESLSQNVLLDTIAGDVNTGRNFAQLRRLYHAVILAQYFKRRCTESIYAYYADSEQISGIDIFDESIKDTVYQLYTKAFEIGAYDLIKNNRRYFSGGVEMACGAMDTESKEELIKKHADSALESAVVRIEFISSSIMPRVQLFAERYRTGELVDSEAFGLNEKLKAFVQSVRSSVDFENLNIFINRRRQFERAFVSDRDVYTDEERGNVLELLSRQLNVVLVQQNKSIAASAVHENRDDGRNKIFLKSLESRLAAVEEILDLPENNSIKNDLAVLVTRAKQNLNPFTSGRAAKALNLIDELERRIVQAGLLPVETNGDYSDEYNRKRDGGKIRFEERKFGLNIIYVQDEQKKKEFSDAFSAYKISADRKELALINKKLIDFLDEQYPSALAEFRSQAIDFLRVNDAPVSDSELFEALLGWIRANVNKLSIDNYPTTATYTRKLKNLLISKTEFDRTRNKSYSGVHRPSQEMYYFSGILSMAREIAEALASASIMDEEAARVQLPQDFSSLDGIMLSVSSLVQRINDPRQRQIFQYRLAGIHKLMRISGNNRNGYDYTELLTRIRTLNSEVEDVLKTSSSIADDFYEPEDTAGENDFLIGIYDELSVLESKAERLNDEHIRRMISHLYRLLDEYESAETDGRNVVMEDNALEVESALASIRIAVTDAENRQEIKIRPSNAAMIAVNAPSRFVTEETTGTARVLNRGMPDISMVNVSLSDMNKWDITELQRVVFARINRLPEPIRSAETKTYRAIEKKFDRVRGAPGAKNTGDTMAISRMFRKQLLALNDEVEQQLRNPDISSSIKAPSIDLRIAALKQNALKIQGEENRAGFLTALEQYRVSRIDGKFNPAGERAVIMRLENYFNRAVDAYIVFDKKMIFNKRGRLKGGKNQILPVNISWMKMTGMINEKILEEHDRELMLLIIEGTKPRHVPIAVKEQVYSALREFILKYIEKPVVFDIKTIADYVKYIDNVAYYLAQKEKSDTGITQAYNERAAGGIYGNNRSSDSDMDRPDPLLQQLYRLQDSLEEKLKNDTPDKEDRLKLKEIIAELETAADNYADGGTLDMSALIARAGTFIPDISAIASSAAGHTAHVENGGIDLNGIMGHITAQSADTLSSSVSVGRNLEPLFTGISFKIYGRPKSVRLSSLFG